MGRDIIITVPPWVDVPCQGSHHESAKHRIRREQRMLDFENQLDLQLAVEALAKRAEVMKER
jgi:hypothetical protein